jgi:hypothetical protein
MTRWLPPVYREPLPPRRVRALDPGRPALRLLTIALLTALATLGAIGAWWVILL